MADPIYDFLNSTLGELGATAIRKACDRVPNLETVLLPRAIWSWLDFLSAHGYDGPIPGTTSMLKLDKAEKNRVSGQVVWNNKIYNYSDASLYQLAAAVALALGAKANTVNINIDQQEIAALGKSLGILVKSHTAVSSLAKMVPDVPTDHKPAMRVPKGGSSCSTCKYAGEDGKHCSNEYFQAWNGSSLLPAPADEYCSDWYEPKEGTLNKKEYTVKLPKVTPKLPSMKIRKSELDSVCNLCGGPQFKGEQFIGCTCLKALAKSVKSEPRPDGVLLTFGRGWDKEALESFIDLLRGTDNG